MSKILAYAVITCSGAAALIIEILGPRIIAPLFGSSLHVWSAVISVTLAALAAGYWQGGRLADKYDASHSALSIVLIIAAFLTLLIRIISGPLQSWAFAAAGVELGAILICLILFAPPLFFLGMVCPYVSRARLKEMTHSGETIGAIYAVSTIGSIAGALGAAHFLIPSLGIKLSLIFSAALTAFPALLLKISRNKKVLLLCFIALPALYQALLKAPSAWGDITLVHRSDSAYGELKVLDDKAKNRRILLVDGTFQNIVSLDDPTDSPVWYVHALQDLFLSLRSDKSRVAIIGLGAGVLPMMLKPFAEEISAVDINPGLPAVAQKYFGFNPDDFQIHIEDGRQFLAKRDSKSLETIVLDVFNGCHLPPHLFSKEAFAEMRRTLGDRGTLYINFLGYTKGSRSILLSSVIKTLKEIFPSVAAVAPKPAEEGDTKSVLILASGGDLSEERLKTKKAPDPMHPVEPAWQGRIITDDLNPSDIWSNEIAARWKEKSAAQIGLGPMVE